MIQRELKINVLNEDFRDSDGWFSALFCPLAMALRREFPKAYITVSQRKVKIDSVEWEIVSDWANTDYIFNTIVPMITRSRSENCVETQTVTLKEILNEKTPDSTEF